MRWLWGRRVADEARYAGSTYFNDEANRRTLKYDFPEGYASGYEQGSRDFIVISINGPLVEDNVVSCNIDDGVVVAVPVSYTMQSGEDSNTAFRDFASAIKTQIDTYGDNGVVEVYDEWVGADVRNEWIVTIDGDIVSGETISVTIEGVAQTADFNTDNDTTLADLATTISGVTGLDASVIPAASGNNRQIRITASDAGAEGIEITAATGVAAGVSYEETRVGRGVSDDRIIIITPPDNVTLNIADEDIASGTTQADIEVDYDARLFDVFAENAGEWGDDLGVRLADFDEGVSERWRITFSGAIGAGMNFTMNITDHENDTHDIDVDYATSNDATLAAIATAIQNALNTIDGANDRATAKVVQVVQGSNNDRIIDIVAPIPGENLVFSAPVIAGGASTPTATVTKTLDAIVSDNTFILEVYERDNPNLAIERHQVALVKQLDGQGQQLFAEEKINKSGSRSEFIRINIDPIATGSNQNKQIHNTEARINWLGGGDDGNLPSTGDISLGWDDFKDPDKHTVRILMNGGYANPSIHQKIDSLARSRRDCFGVLDMPSDKQKVQSARAYRNEELNIDSSYSAMYTSDLLVLDERANEQIYVSPSGHVAAQYAFNDETTAEWFAPSGLNRGLLDNVVELREEYSESDRDLLEPIGINPIRIRKGVVVIWGAETLARETSLLKNINVRRLLITLEVGIVDAFDYRLWDPADAGTLFIMEQGINSIARPIQEERGIRRYSVKANDDNNPPDQLDLGVLKVDFALTPTAPAKQIRLVTTVVGGAVSFEEVI